MQYKEYWDFIDHYIPLSDRSVAEALRLEGFTVELSLPRFLPYSTRGRLPQRDFLIELYVKLPVAWRFLGKQMFIIGRKA